MNAFQPRPLILSEEDFGFFQKKIYALAGISLSENKKDLMQSRLRCRVIEHGLSSFKEYIRYMESVSDDDSEWELFTNCLTTNKTDWFREPEHFDFIVSEFLPKWKKLKKKHLKIWCAASSTGEEPYTLSMVLLSALKGTDITFDIIATDIDTKVLAVAKNGVYRKEQIYQVPDDHRKEAFAYGNGEISEWMKVRNPVKEKVSFAQFNLAKYPYNVNSKYDLIMCRNVLIYFNSKTIESVTQAMFSVACTDSCLIIAHSESLQNLKTSWKYLKPSIYGKGKFLD